LVIINLLFGVFRPANAGPLNVDTLDIGTVPQVFGVVQVRVFCVVNVENNNNHTNPIRVAIGWQKNGRWTTTV
jgi:hypothetical protein